MIEEQLKIKETKQNEIRAGETTTEVEPTAETGQPVGEITQIEESMAPLIFAKEEDICLGNLVPTEVQAQQLYINREKSWLKFNERVLEEAEDQRNPLLERLKFTSIFCSNLDEFFMIRVGSLFDQLYLEEDFLDKKSGMTVQEQLDMIFDVTCQMQQRLGDVYHELIVALEQYGYYEVNFETIAPWLKERIDHFFRQEMMPLLSPQIINRHHPFPFFNNQEMYVGVPFNNEDGNYRLGVIPIPKLFPRRMMFHDASQDKHYFLLIENLISYYVQEIFADETLGESFIFRVTRNGDLDIDEGLYDEDIDWRQTMEQLLKKRNKSAAVRLQLSRPVKTEIWKYMCSKLQLTEREVIIESAPLDLSFDFSELSQYPHLFDTPQNVIAPAGLQPRRPIIPQIIEGGDLLLAYPYHSMKPFIDLLDEAALDPKVISIKITLYRLASNSRIVNALMKAAENGKDVLVLVELRARFDEKNNIDCSKKLEEAGCTVIYGIEHFKVHTKLMVMTRKNHDTVNYITQVGTGNYNEKTAKLYTDLSVITSHEDIGKEAVEVFKALSLGRFVKKSRYLLVAPEQMQQPMLDLIEEEIKRAKAGEEADIMMKLNSLSSKDMIDALVRASQAGVKVTLLIRGICCLQAGIPGVSDNIVIYSIVGRYLEHSRIYSFGIGKRQKMYIGSADWMTRNLCYRVEVGLEILDENVKKTLNQMIEYYLKDNVKMRTMVDGGNYEYIVPSAKNAAFNSQMELFGFFEKKLVKYQKEYQKEQQKKQKEKQKEKNKKEKKSKQVKGDKSKKEKYGFLKKR